MPWYANPGLNFLLSLFAGPALVVLLWNWKVVALFSVAPLAYWDAFWLIVLIDVALGIKSCGRLLTEERLTALIKGESQ